MIKTESISKLAAALVKAQKNMGAAIKEGKNPYFKSNYASLSNVIDAAVPALNDNGVAVLQLCHHENGKNFVRTLLVHESGELLGADTEIICSKANDAQAYGSAISYARRYSLQAAVTLKAEDSDAEDTVVRSTTAPQQEVKRASFRDTSKKATEVVPENEVAAGWT